MNESQKGIAQTELPTLPPTPPPNMGTRHARPHPLSQKQRIKKGASAKTRTGGDPFAARDNLAYLILARDGRTSHA